MATAGYVFALAAAFGFGASSQFTVAEILNDRDHLHVRSDNAPNFTETELIFGCGQTRYTLRYRQEYYRKAVRRTFGDSRYAQLLSLVVGSHVMSGESRTRVWRLFDNIVNIESVVPTCSNAGAEVAIRAMDGLEAMAWTSGRVAEPPPIKSYVVKLSPEGAVGVTQE